MGFSIPASADPLAAGDRLMTIATRPGVTLSFLVVEPAQPALATVILLAGGDGALRLTDGAIGAGADNFVVRTRHRFAAAGVRAVVVDAPSDHRDGMGHFRVTEKQAEDLSALVHWLKSRWPAPVWLVGTSRGTLSAANSAARAPSGIAGLVLTASVTRRTHQGEKESLADVPLDQIRMPVLLVHHAHDGCPSSPYEGAVALDKRFARDRRVPFAALVTIDGGPPAKSEPCQPLSPHGFYGGEVEERAVSAIVTFLRNH